MTASEYYDQQLSKLAQQHKLLTRKRKLFSWLRLGCIIAIAALFYSLLPQWNIIIPLTLLLLIAFRLLIYRDVANKEAIAHNLRLQAINEAELQALNYQWDAFDGGNQHMPHEHYYANDLDLFGSASLFRFTNRTTSEIGSKELANWLLYPAQKTQIIARQQAVKELKENIDWVQNLQAYGKASSVSFEMFDKLQSWLKEPPLFQKPFYRMIRFVIPLLSTGICIATIADLVPMNVFYTALFSMFIIVYLLERKIHSVHNNLGKIVEQLNTLSKSIDHIEKKKFQSPLLQQMQEELAKNRKASASIAELKNILDRLDIRFNIVISAPLNLLFLWNYQQVLQLEKWRMSYDTNVHHWFKNLGIFEALSSFGTILFNNPQWCFPVLNDEDFYMKGTQIGHPLIHPGSRVNNFIDIETKPMVMLITGSNMAGKSTYLRSVGVNIVLAMAGAPVCATAFSLPALQLLSSMRVADNLEESTSTFYAELKKLKTIIDKVNRHERVFILLDEILRGTNSLDRHTGSTALIRQMIQQQAVTMIATHDLALAELQNSYPGSIQNFHFDVQVSEEELYFDYLLKPGVCTSMNASILMKKIGIEI
ncbi:MAG: hypothetical protein QM687_13715 [Ferruginibacter sp.]